MSGSADATSAAGRPRGEARLTLALWIAILATVPPLLRVIHSGDWLPGAALLSAVLLAVGFVLRRRRAPAVAVTLAEVAVWVMTVTAVFFPHSALLAVIPTGPTIAAVPRTVEQAAQEIAVGVAPITATPALGFVLVGALGLLTIALDHVVMTARMPLLAATALILVWLIPAIAVPAGVDAFAFVLLAAAVLLLVRAEHRTRETSSTSRPGGVAAVAVALGAVAIVAALVIAPTLPPPSVAAGGSGISARIDPSLDLGNDLRRREVIPVLTYRSDAPQLPNLRVTTLSVFDGAVWKPDRMRTVPLSDEPFTPVTADDGIRITEYRTNVDVTQLNSTYLPIPYPAVSVSGLDGAWRAVPYSRTVLSSDANAQGQSYEVVSHVPRPTLEQIRAASTTVSEDAVDVYSLPADLPPIIAELAQTVTAGAATPYDKLLALQTWFRGSDFTYSLSAPVDDGFDDTGVAAVAQFLDKKEGYCIHFAGAFALMARTLDMPSRIVVGFLPGAYTGESIDDERVAEVTTAQLHAWPEVYFDGIGWIPFEPTKSLGTATRFLSSASPVDDSGQDVTQATPTPTPTSSAAAVPTDRPEQTQNQASGQTAKGIDLRPFLTVLVFVVVLGSIPAGAAAIRRVLLRRRGTVAAAWRIVQDAAIDVGAPVRTAETPRAFAARLAAMHDAPAQPLSRLVAAVEHANYAAADPRVTGSPRAAGAIEDAEAVRRGLLAALDGPERLRARLAPRSLLVRPGSAFADRRSAT